MSETTTTAPEIQMTATISRRTNRFGDLAKRAFDLLVAALGLMLLSPVFLYIAWRIKRDSPGPVFYRGLRVGRYGTTFSILKFRTMYERSESYQGPPITGEDDARITPLGNGCEQLN